MALSCDGIKIIKKAKAGLEDLEIGYGTVTQERGNKKVTITKIPIHAEVENFNDLVDIDTDKFKLAFVREVSKWFSFETGDYIGNVNNPHIYGILYKKDNGYWLSTEKWEATDWLKSGLTVDDPAYIQQFENILELIDLYNRPFVINTDLSLRYFTIKTNNIKFKGGKIIIPSGQYLRWLAPIEGEEQIFEVNGSLYLWSEDGEFNRATLMPQHLGAKADGKTDDTAIINKTFSIAKDLTEHLEIDNLTYVRKTITVKLKGFYYVTDTINVGANIDIDGKDATFIYPFEFTGEGLVIGDTTTINENRMLYLPSVIRANENSSYYQTYGEGCVGVKLIHLYTSEVHTKRISAWGVGLLLYADGNGCDYNKLFVEDVRDCQVAGIRLYRVNDGWVNDNNFFGGRIYVQKAMGDNVAGRYYILIDGTSGSIQFPNHNKFYGLSLENPRGECSVKIKGGLFNSFINCRWEYAAPVCFTDGAKWNTIISGLDWNGHLEIQETNGAQFNLIYGGLKWKLWWDMGNLGMLLQNGTSSYNNVISVYKAGEANENNWVLGVSANNGLRLRKNLNSTTAYQEIQYQSDVIKQLYGNYSNPDELVWAEYFPLDSNPYIEFKEDIKFNKFIILMGYYLWVDSSGRLRISNSRPSNLDSDGTVVGTQT